MKSGIVILSLFTSVVVCDMRGLKNRGTERVPFKVYWNMPTFQCATFDLGFDRLAQKYDIIQNRGDTFRGDQIALLYDPGLFPAILQDSGKLRNGGVPQEGNLVVHLQTFAEQLDELVPDKNFSGLGVIDFEHWRPIYRQNFGTLTPYKELSVKIETKKHPTWSTSHIQAEAARRFEKSARDFMEQTLLLAKKLRPNGHWGYYIYPLCFNHKQTECVPEVIPENDRLSWLFSASNNLHPSIYLRHEDSHRKRMESIIGRMHETQRILKNLSDGKFRGNVPYYTLIYPHTSQFLSTEDIVNTIALLKRFRIDGLVLWGSSKNFKNRADCEALYNYVDTVFGPALSR